MLDLLFPRICCGCDRSPLPDSAWCASCEACFGLMSVPLALPGVRAIYAAAPYDSGAGSAIRRAKYGRDPALMRELGRSFASWMAPVAIGADALVPVPSPWTRRLARGFSSAAVLACALSQVTGLPVRHALKMRRGPRQAGLGRAGRASNLAGRIRASALVPGRVIVVDDVLTSGGTAAAAARELLGGASSDVTIAVLACVLTKSATADPVWDVRNLDRR